MPVSRPHSRPTEPTPPIVDGRYQLEERLGEGAAGVVWRARHLGLHRDVAVKLLRAAPDDACARARFQREAEALGRLRHPHVVEVTDFGVDAESGLPYLVLELLPGRTLADLLRESGPLSAERALPLLEALAGAIDAAHERGILHRDLKPGNVAVTTGAAGAPLVKILDFGLAEIAAPAPPAHPAPPAPLPAGALAAGSERLTATGALLGTPLYAAPEVIRTGFAGPAADIYSLAIMAYEILAGRPPFQGKTAAVLAGHLDAAPPAPPLPCPVWEVLQEALAKEPRDRPATAAAFVRRLRQAFEKAESAARQRAERPRRLLLWAASAAFTLAAGLLLPDRGMPPTERWLDDLRMEAAPPRQPDPRILLVTLDDASLRESTEPLAARADELGVAIEKIYAAGARGVAVDLLLPVQWRESPGFTSAVLHHPESLTLAAFSAPDGTVTSTDCASGLIAAALGPEKAASLFGFANLDEDPYSVTRTGRLSYRDISGGERPSWAARAAAALGPLPRLPAGEPFRIDLRTVPRLYSRLSWQHLAEALARHPELFRGRLVLIGNDSVASDDSHKIPAGPGETTAVSGLTLQALQVDTIAAGLPVRTAPGRTAALAAALLASVAAAFVLLSRWAGRAAAGLVLATIAYAAVSVPVFQRTGLLLPVTAPCLAALLGLAAALALRTILRPLRFQRSSRR